jgi:ubiquinone/menaquinone biosynthesis C-methylase UbiE
MTSTRIVMEDPSNEQKVAEHYREDVEPLYAAPMYEEIGDELPLADEGTQLIAEARCGYIPLQLRPRLDEDVRMIALDPTRAMLDSARQRAEEAGCADGIFFIPERVDSISYADGVFQSAICLEGMVTARQAEEGLQELGRVTVDGGAIATAYPLGSSFEVIYEMLDEALRAHEMESRLERLDELRETLLSPARLMAIAEETSLEVDSVERVDWTLEFDQGREFLHAPIVREIFFPHWVGVVASARRDQVMRYIAEAIDTYWESRSFETNMSVAFMLAHASGG